MLLAHDYYSTKIDMTSECRAAMPDELLLQKSKILYDLLGKEIQKWPMKEMIHIKKSMKSLT